jgi:hypothetical protein
VKNGNTADEFEASDTGSDSENNADDSYEVTVPKLCKILENIIEVMTWLEQQTDNEHLDVLLLVNIKQCFLKKTAISSDKQHDMNIFVRRL